MILHFDFKQVQALVQHSLQAPDHKALPADPDSKRPGLILAGDEGVYFTSNGRPPLYVDPDDPAGPTHRCAYALEADPSKDPESSRRNKDSAFGGSDGAEFVPYESEDGPCIKHWLEANEGNPLLEMNLTEDNLELVGSELRPVTPGVVQVLAGDEFQTAFQEGIKWSAWSVPVVEMDRRGLIAYIGALKHKQKELTQQLDFEKSANQALNALNSRLGTKRDGNSAAETSNPTAASRRSNRRPSPPKTPVDSARTSRAQRKVS